MSKPVRIVADNMIPFFKGVLDSCAEITYLPGKEISRVSLRDANGMIIRTRTTCNEQLLTGTNVRMIATATIGYDHIDTEYCERHNIRWVNAPGCNSSSVQQYIASALITLAQRKSFDLTKKTLGIVGVGNVGKKVARLAAILGMKVLCNDPPRKRAEPHLDFIPLDELLGKSDIVTFHVPLTREGIDKTYHLVDDRLIEKMKPGSILINSSRGSVVETLALKHALRSGHLSGAVMDVWEREPEIDRELLGMVDLATPHIAGYSADGKANGTAVSVHALRDYFSLDIPTNWYPSVPVPDHSMTVHQDCAGRSIQAIVGEALLYTYPILTDDAALRMAPEMFEQLRGAYPIRREFPNYTINLRNSTSEIRTIFKDLGFNLSE